MKKKYFSMNFIMILTLSLIPVSLQGNSIIPGYIYSHEWTGKITAVYDIDQYRSAYSLLTYRHNKKY
jgi:hypothetical protein